MNKNNDRFYIPNFDSDPLIYYFFLTKRLLLVTFKGACCPKYPLQAHCIIQKSEGNLLLLILTRSICVVERHL